MVLAAHRVDGTSQDLDHVFDLGDRSGQWGHHHYHVTQRTEQYALVDGPGAHPPAPPFASGWRGQLDARHQPALADGTNPRPLGDPVGQLLGQRRRRGRHVGQDIPFLYELEVAQGNGAGQRVPAIGVPVVQRLLALDQGPAKAAKTGPEATVADTGR